MYYKGFGQSPYPFIVGRGGYSRRLIGLICRHGGSKPRPTLQSHYNTNRQRKQVLCRNFVTAVYPLRMQRQVSVFFVPSEKTSVEILYTNTDVSAKIDEGILKVNFSKPRAYALIKLNDKK